MERRLAAILAADVVGYSRLIGADEEGTLAALKSLRTNLIEPLVAEYRGRVVKLMGDGFLVEFQSTVDAVNCAVAWQSRLAEQYDNAAITFRIGVNVGDVVMDGGDLLGDGVNVAARLEASGTPGHVLIADAVHSQVERKIDAVFHDNGTIELKNIIQPVGVWSWPEPLAHLAKLSKTGRRPGIHVAKFECRGPEAEELAEAICDDLVTAFARQSGIRLNTDPNSSDFCVLGSVRGKGDRWRVSVSLVDRSNGQVVWSERIEEVGDDIFQIQDRYVTRIAGAVRIRLPSAVSSRLATTPLQDMTVQDLLNHAMNRHFTPTSASWDEALRSLQLALDRDTENWMAMTMLCFNIFTKVRIFGWCRIGETDVQFGRKLIEQAHILKPDSEVVRMVHGAFCFYADRDIDSARIEAEESLRLNPSYFHAIDLMSQIELFAGDVAKAKDLASQAVDCDPGYPYLHLYLRSLAYAHLVAGDYADGCEMFQRANHAAPRLPQNLIGIIASAQLCDDGGKAQAAAASLVELVPEFSLDEYEPWPFSDTSRWTPIREALSAAMVR